jgi:hypothetical protein
LSAHLFGYDVLGNRDWVAGNASRTSEFCYAPDGTQTKTAKTQSTSSISDNFLYYRVKTRYKHNGGVAISPGPAVPRGEHFDENHTGEG